MTATARVVAVADVNGITRLPVLSSQAPLVLRRTPAAVYLVGGAAGPLGGDDLTLMIEVGDGATLRISTAAASVALPGATGTATHGTWAARIGMTGTGTARTGATRTEAARTGVTRTEAAGTGATGTGAGGTGTTESGTTETGTTGTGTTGTATARSGTTGTWAAGTGTTENGTTGTGAARTGAARTGMTGTGAAGIGAAGIGAVGCESVFRVRATVGAGARFEYLPEPVVVAEGARHRMELHVTLAADTTMLAREEVILGRHGERGGECLTRMCVDLDGAPLLRQEVAVSGNDEVSLGPAVLAGRRAFGSMLIVNNGRPVTGMVGGGVVVMPLAGPGTLVTAVAPDARALRAALQGVLERAGHDK